jgi:hypothetical protein
MLCNLNNYKVDDENYLVRELKLAIILYGRNCNQGIFAGFRYSQ